MDRSRRFGGARALRAAVLIAAMIGVVPPVGTLAEEGNGLPGMCNGRTDPSIVIHAQANGTTKYILNVETDSAALPAGVMILGRGPSRVYVDQICRVWQHRPGQEPGGGGGCSSMDEGGATIAHVVGIGRVGQTTHVVVRTDVRGTDEGLFFRVRYKAMGDHHDEGVTSLAHEDDGCTDDSWTRVPAEGWAPLHQLSVRPS